MARKRKEAEATAEKAVKYSASAEASASAKASEEKSAGETLRARDIPDRQGKELFDFILKYIDEDEKDLFYQDLREAVIEALASDSLEPVGRILADWEATEEVNSDPELAGELAEAIEESEARRRGRG